MFFTAFDFDFCIYMWTEIFFTARVDGISFFFFKQKRKISVLKNPRVRNEA